ncbi:prepilin-type N-terminal cleavage/methylation domain-containing protein [Parvimonas sp. G1604]
MKYIYQNKTKSFTLLELLITIAVSSIIILCCIYIFFWNLFC